MRVGYWALLAILVVRIDAEARWLERKEAGAIIESYRVEYHVAANGGSTQTIESVMLVQGEDGKASASLFPIEYNAATDKVEIIEAYTQNGKVKIPVLPSMIEDRDKGNAKDYDAIKTRSIAFPALQIGSRLFLKYKYVTKVPVLRDRFTAQLTFGPGGFLDQIHIVFRSELPLFFESTDPQGWASVRQISPRHLEIRNKKPVPGWVHAEKDPYFHPSRYTRIYVSSHQQWPEYMATLDADVEAVLKQPLSKNLDGWLKTARKYREPAEQILHLLEKMSAEFRYFGDWRRHNGGVVPRSLSEIESSRFGDCKDLSALLVALLRRLGIEAHVALVRRGGMDWLQEPEYGLPSLSYFNHAIVRAKASGKTYWLDPTNSVGSLLPFIDIAGRPAWVLGVAAQKLEAIPTVPPELYAQTQNYTYEFKGGDSVRVRIDAQLNALGAFQVANNLLTQSRSIVVSELLEYFAEGNEIASYRMLKEPATKRRLQDMNLSLEYFTDRVTYAAGQEAFFVVPDGILSGAFYETKERVSDMRLYENPFRFHVIRRLKKTTIRQAVPLPCVVKSKWMDMERTVTAVKGDVVIDQRLELKVPYVLREEYGSAEFKRLQSETKACFFRSGILVGGRTVSVASPRTSETQ